MFLCADGMFMARAQAPDTSADPGQIERRIEESRPVPAKPTPGPTRLPAAPAPGVPLEEKASFVLTAVVIEGGTVFAPGELALLYEDFLARTITLTEVQQIAERITAKYLEAGYVLSQAVVPPQQVEGGLLTVQIVEGFVARVSFEGAPGNEDLLAPYAEKITAARPATLPTLERYLLLIDDLAGITVVSSSLRKIDDEGAYEIVVSLAEDTFDGVAYLDNRGTPSVGRLQSWLSGGANSLLGMGERAQIGFFTVPNQPRELLFGEVRYAQPVGSEGTVLSAALSGSAIDAGADLDAVDSEGSSVRVVLSARHPVVRSRATNLSVSGSFDYLDVGEDRMGSKNFEDHLRVLRVGLDFLHDDSWNGTTAAAVEVSWGLDIAGASERGGSALSRPDGRADFSKATAHLSRTQAIGENFAIHVAAKGQIAADPLLSAEEFALGGSQFGRAYDFSELTGEDGVAGSAEIRYGDRVNSELLKAFQLYGFYDLGTVWNRDALVNGRSSLASAGGGVRLTFPRSIFANLEVAKPLTRDVSTTDDRNWRFFFALSASF